MKIKSVNITTPALGCKVGRAYQMMLTSLGKALKEAGLDLTTSEYLVMRAIYSIPGAQQCNIADLVGKDKAAVSRCVAALGKKGLVKTESVSYKCLKVYPSEKGKMIESRIMEVAEIRHKALLELATTEELEIFSRILDNIISFS